MLQILCGPDRTANSMRILDQICENARAGVAGQILIVPEQYSHETERALCARGGDTISRYAEVLSFTRLAARVFSVCGGVCEEYLDENGRVEALAHLISGDHVTELSRANAREMLQERKHGG